MRRKMAGAVAAVGTALLLSACGSADPAPAPSAKADQFIPAAQDGPARSRSGPTPPGSPAAKAYQKANPEAKIKIVNYDGNANGANTFKTKMSLFDRAGTGWPDVVFSDRQQLRVVGPSATAPAPAPSTRVWSPQATLDGFAKGAMDPCTVGGAAPTACATTSRRTCSGTTRS